MASVLQPHCVSCVLGRQGLFFVDPEGALLLHVQRASWRITTPREQGVASFSIQPDDTSVKHND